MRNGVGTWPRFLWRPLLVWAVLVVLSGLVLGRIDSIADKGAVERFHNGVQTAADFAGGYISDLVRQQEQGAKRYLSGPKVRTDDLEWAVSGIRCSSAGVVDAQGRLLVVVPPAPSLLGKDQTTTLEHIRIAIKEGRPGMSHVVMSPVLRRPAIGIAVPFQTPHGRRAFSCALSVRDSPIGSGIERTAIRAQERVRIIDGAGNMVAASDHSLVRVTPLAEPAPELATALTERSSGRYLVGREWRYFDSVAIPGTGWRAVASVSEQTLYSAQNRALAAYIRLLAAGSGLGLLIVITMGRSSHRRAMADRYIRSLNARLERSNKDMQEFTYSIAHDLRAPLRAVSGFSQILDNRYGQCLDATGRGYVRRIDRAGKKMAALIDDLLDLSRVTRMDMYAERIDLSALVRGIATRLQDQEPERQVTFWITDGVTAWADREMILTVMDNLLGNAWKFTSRTNQAKIEFGAYDIGDDQIGCYVRDNGAGFDPAYSDNLFKPFQRLHDEREFPGSGIGLASARRIIERHGGRIWADGEPGGGATFSFTLPSRDSATVKEGT